MNIQPINNNATNISMQGNSWKKIQKRVAQTIIDIIPEYTAKETPQKIKNWEKFDNIMSRPAENRAIMGLTALVTQPAIDAHNHRVDNETKIVSRNRTIAKVIAGTLVGVFVVRAPVYKLTQLMTKLKGNKKYSNSLLPKKFIKEINNNNKFYTNYQSALSMGIALLAMSITNFVLDAPFTTFLTNNFNNISGIKTNKQPTKEKKEEVIKNE